MGEDAAMAHAQIGMAIVSTTLVLVGTGITHEGLKNRSRAEIINTIERQPINDDQRVLLKGLVVASEAGNERSQRTQIKAYFDDLARHLTERENDTNMKLASLPASARNPYLSQLGLLQRSRQELQEVSRLVSQPAAEQGVVATKAAIAIRNLPSIAANLAAPVQPDDRTAVQAKVESASWWSKTGPIFGPILLIIGVLSGIATLISKARKAFAPAAASTTK
jgi:hypothetical protein